MKKVFFIPGLFLLVLCIWSNSLNAQNTDKYFDDSGRFVDNLWYGGGITLGASNTSFVFGLYPMVGYKIFGPVSAGLKFRGEYLSQKVFDASNNAYNYNSFSWGVGPIARVKFIEQLFGDDVLFGHMEYELEDLEVPETQNGFLLIDPNDSNQILTTRTGRDNAYLGLGYAQGDIVKFEILWLYNVLEPADSDQVPWDIRFALTYNF